MDHHLPQTGSRNRQSHAQVLSDESNKIQPEIVVYRRRGWKHTLNFMDPLRVALTLSKSEFIHLKKWSDGFLKAGQGNPAWAKNCKMNHK